MITWGQFLSSTIAAFFTLAIFSFLYKDNPFYKFAEHLLIGISVGYALGYLYHATFIPYIWTPLTTAPNVKAFIWILLPVLFGMIYFSFVIPKYRWLIRFPIAFFLGIGNGFAIPYTMSTNIYLQLKDTFVLLQSDLSAFSFITVIVVTTAAIALITYFLFYYDGDGVKIIRTAIVLLVAVFMIYTVYNCQIKVTKEWFRIMSNYLIVIGIFSSLLYFFFSWKHTGIVGGISKLGRAFLMIGFGASFGLTVMGRISLLIGRIDFLVNIWFEQLKSFF